MEQPLDKAAYLAWEERMGFDAHGGRAKAAEALGVSTEQVRLLRVGKGRYGRELALAMTAIARGLPPWPNNR